MSSWLAGWLAEKTARKWKWKCTWLTADRGRLLVVATCGQGHAVRDYLKLGSNFNWVSWLWKLFNSAKYAQRLGTGTVHPSVRPPGCPSVCLLFYIVCFSVSLCFFFSFLCGGHPRVTWLFGLALLYLSRFRKKLPPLPFPFLLPFPFPIPMEGPWAMGIWYMAIFPNLTPVHLLCGWFSSSALKQVEGYFSTSNVC